MATYRQLKGTGRWNVQIRPSGKKPISSTFDTREQAEQWVSEFEKEQKNQVEQERLENMSFLELGLLYCERMLVGKVSQDDMIKRVHRLSKALPKELSSITQRVVNQHRLNRLKNASPVTVRDELQLLNRIYKCAYSELILEPDQYPNPCTGIPMPPTSKPRRKVVERSELLLLLSELSPVMASVVELAYETAMRRTEITNLTPRDLQLEERTLSVIDGKTGDRQVPLTRRAVEILTDAKKKVKTPNAKLFPVAPHSVTTSVRRARRKLNLSDDIRMHQLRHTRITEVAKRGFNQAQIMMVSGHTDVRSVQRYTHLNVKDVIDLLE